MVSVEPGRALGVDRVGAPDALEEGDAREREADGDERLLDVPLVEAADEEELGEPPRRPRRRAIPTSAEMREARPGAVGDPAPDLPAEEAPRS